MFRKNCCDGIYNSYDVHFTNFCDNKCAHCVDRDAITVNSGRPNWTAIADAIINNSEGFDDVLILGGEPLLFLEEALALTLAIKQHTKLKVYCTSSMPVTCVEHADLFIELLRNLDGLNISAQHYLEHKADAIRGTHPKYNRQAFYRMLPLKHKIRINLNIVRGYLDTKEELIWCLRHYADMGFGSIKLSEIQHSTDDYISFEKIFGIKMKSPYFHGCQTEIDTEKVLGEKLLCPVILKRSCFICEKTLKASFLDGVKIISKTLMGKPIIDNAKFGVVYEDGSIKKGWAKKHELHQIENL